MPAITIRQRAADIDLSRFISAFSLRFKDRYLEAVSGAVNDRRGGGGADVRRGPLWPPAVLAMSPTLPEAGGNIGPLPAPHHSRPYGNDPPLKIPTPEKKEFRSPPRGTLNSFFMLRQLLDELRHLQRWLLHLPWEPQQSARAAQETLDKHLHSVSRVMHVRI